MSTIYERDLIAPLSREMGDTDSSNYYYNTDQLFSAINDGYKELNRRGYKQQFAISGSGDNAYFAPDPNIDEQRLLVLCSALVLTEGEIAKSARTAIIHSNIAGRTDLTDVYKAYLALRDRLDKAITETIDLLNQKTNKTDTDGENMVQGEELKSSDDSTEIEGLVITTISTGV